MVMIYQYADITGSLNIRKKENPMRKVFFFDIDGTIYRNTLGITEKTIQAFEMLRKNGDYVVLATGRTAPAIEPEFPFLPYDGFIAGNGTHVRFGGKDILNVVMEPVLVERIVQCLREDHREFVLEGDRELYSDITGNNNKILDYGFYKSLLGNGLKPVDVENRRVNKLSVQLGERPFNPNKYQEIITRVKVILHGEVAEIGSRSHSKATGAALPLHHLGIIPENCWAFGDSRNDMELLRYVGHSVAMGDACEEVKKCVSYVTGTVEEEGVYCFLAQSDIWNREC